MAASTAQLRQLFSERSPRERKLLLAGGVGLLALLLLFVFVEPAVSGIAQLRRQLPQSRERAARLDALVSEARMLRGQAPAAHSGGDARSAVLASLDSAGLQGARSSVLSNGDLHLSFANVSYGKWVAWLAGAERGIGVHTVAASVKAAAAPGNADIELSLRLPHA